MRYFQILVFATPTIEDFFPSHDSHKYPPKPSMRKLRSSWLLTRTSHYYSNYFLLPCEGLPGGTSGKKQNKTKQNLPAIAGDAKDVGLIPGSGRSPRGGHDNPMQYSCLENPMGRGAWRATVHRVAQSWTCLNTRILSGSRLHTFALWCLPAGGSICAFASSPGLPVWIDAEVLNPPAQPLVHLPSAMRMPTMSHRETAPSPWIQQREDVRWSIPLSRPNGQHQTDSHGPRRIQWAPSNLGPGSPQYPLVPAAPGNSPAWKWLPRHWTPVSPCCPRTTSGSNIPDSFYGTKAPVALTNPGPWLTLVSAGSSSPKWFQWMPVPCPALGGFHDPRQLPDTCLPMDFSQPRPLITEPANSHGTGLLTVFWELRI